MPTSLRDNLPLAILLISAVALSIAAAGDGTLPGDVRLTRRLQANPIPFAGPLTTFANDYGSGGPLTVAGVVLSAGLLAARRVDAALLIAVATALRSTNSLLKAASDSPRPTPDLVRVTEQASGLGFPSGHAMGSALLLGAIAYALLRLRMPPQGDGRQPGDSALLTEGESRRGDSFALPRAARHPTESASLPEAEGYPTDTSPLLRGEGPGVRGPSSAPRPSTAEPATHVASLPLRPAGAALCLALILLVGYGRIYVGAHWPTDVLGGWLWGAILAVVAVRIARLAMRRRTGNVGVAA